MCHVLIQVIPEYHQYYLNLEITIFYDTGIITISNVGGGPSRNLYGNFFPTNYLWDGAGCGNQNHVP